MIKEKKFPNFRLKYEREQRGWTQLEVADYLNTTPFTVSRWERGITAPHPHFRTKLTDLFHKSATELGLVTEDHTLQSEAPRSCSQTDSPDMAASTRLFLFDHAIPFPAFPLGSLVGRNTTLLHVKQRLTANKKFSLLALTGLPGVGKTAMAIEIAHDADIQQAFFDGVLWAGLGPHPNLHSHLSRWCILLGMAADEKGEALTIARWVSRLRALIGDRKMLLVIDDAWTIEEALALRVGGPFCAHLVTTRFPETALQFAGEHSIVIQELNEDLSVALLAQLAPEIAKAAPEAARMVARSVGGLPLALLLMGKHLQLQTHGKQRRRMLAALDRLRSAEARLQLTEPPIPGAYPPGTPRSLQATIAISDNQLSAESQYALRALSVFPAKPNTLSEEAALAVSASAAETLDALVDCNLLEASGPDRYTMHQTIADYAHLQGHDLAAEERFAAFFVAFVEAHQTNYQALEVETNNLLAALQMAFVRAWKTLLLRGANTFAPFLEARGLYEVAQLHLQRAKHAALDVADDYGLAQTLLQLGRIAERRGDFQQAEHLYEEGLTIARTLGHRELMCELLGNWGEVALNCGDYKRADRYVQEGLTLARVLGDKRKISTLLKSLGEIFDCLGQFEQGDSSYQEALLFARECGDRATMSSLLQNLGAKMAKLGHYQEAEQYYDEGLSYAREIGYQQRISALLSNQGMVALLLSHYEQAEVCLQESLHLASSIGNRMRMSTVLQNIGMLESARGNYQRGEQYLQQSLSIARDMGHQWLASEGLAELGELYLKRQMVDLACAAFSQAYTIAQEIDATELIASALYGLARVAEKQRELTKAEQLGRESLQIFESRGHYKSNEVLSWLNVLPCMLDEKAGETLQKQRSAILAECHS